MAKPRSEKGSQFVQYFGPILDALRKLGGSGTPDEVVEQIAKDLSIPDAVQNELLPSGEPRFRNQIGWGRYYLVRAGLLDSSRRGIWSLTELGRATFLSLEDARDILLRVVRAYRDGLKSKPTKPESEEPNGLETESAVAYRDEVLGLLLSLPPSGFERLSQRLLREAGFTQVVVTGQSGDGGIDGHGTLQINPLVSFKVLFQCKRYQGSVSASQVRDFRGAMAGRADKGIILTTGSFTAEARRETSRDGVPPIELLDGEKLLDMLETLELGLAPIKTYQVDPAFFKEFQG
jgi:restriction system protein